MCASAIIAAAVTCQRFKITEQEILWLGCGVHLSRSACDLTHGLQAHGGQPRYTTALTAVLLQAAIADPDLVQAHLADHHCWPALLALCTSQPSAPAEQHAQRLSQLSGCDSLSTSGLDISDLTSTSQGIAPGSATDAARNADILSEPEDDENTVQQLPRDQDKAGDAAVSPSHQCNQRSVPQHMQHTANCVIHVAQLITCFVQSQPESGLSSDAYAGTDSLKALLHCYAMYAEAASCRLSAPVWPAQVQAQQQQQAMLEHVAQAGEKCGSRAKHQRHVCCRTDCTVL